MKYRSMVCVLFAVLFMQTGTLHSQSLSEIAKKAEEQRQKKEAEKTNPQSDQDSAAKPPTSSFTNKDLTPDPTTPVAATTTDTAATPSAPGDKPKELALPAPLPDTAAAHVEDENWWRSRMSRLRARLAMDDSACSGKRDTVLGLARILDGLPNTAPAIVAGGYISASASVAADLVKARGDLQACEGVVAVDKQAIGDAEEEARHLSVLPGWLR